MQGLILLHLRIEVATKSFNSWNVLQSRSNKTIKITIKTKKRESAVIHLKSRRSKKYTKINNSKV